MYETEVKVELTDEVLERVLGFFKEKQYADWGTVPQEDLYVEATPSPYGAFDIKRYRADGESFFYTEKVWEGEGETRVRKEVEREVSADEYLHAKTNLPAVVRIAKDRHSLTAIYRGRQISLSIDSVKFDHSPRVRHFFEAEIIVESRELVAETQKFIRQFIAEVLNIQESDIIEAPGMFALAFKKL